MTRPISLNLRVCSFSDRGRQKVYRQKKRERIQGERTESISAVEEVQMTTRCFVKVTDVALGCYLGFQG